MTNKMIALKFGIVLNVHLKTKTLIQFAKYVKKKHLILQNKKYLEKAQLIYKLIQSKKNKLNKKKKNKKNYSLSNHKL